MKKLGKILTLVMILVFAVSMVACGKVAISLAVNGGTQIEDIQAKKGEEVTLPTPTKDGYEFEGWFDNAGLTGSPVTKITAPDAGATYYAKWAKLYTVTMKNGSETSTVKVKAGANLYSVLQSYAPKKNGYTGIWFNGKTEITSGYAMPDKDFEVTAKYKVEYTEEIYVQKNDGVGYDKSTELSKTAFGYEGDVVESSQDIEGYTEVEEADTVTEITLSTQSGASNVIKRYFARDTFNVTFRSNYPDGTADETVTEKLLFGDELTAPTCFEKKGYILLGWSTSKNGEVTYKVDAITDHLYNKEGTTALPTDKISVSQHTVLYAVWAKGYENVFEGEDYIFHLEDSSKVVYLVRGDVYFVGDYNTRSREFTFEKTPDDATPLFGQLNTDGSYSYSKLVRSEVMYTLYKDGELDATEQVQLDEYNGLTYFIGSKQSKGTFRINSEGYYVVTFSSGDYAGTTLTMLLKTLTIDDETSNVFQIRNSKDLEYVVNGPICRTAISNGQPVSYIPSYYGLTLDGFGNATYQLGTATQACYYTFIDEETIRVTDINGAEAFVAKLTKGENGASSYYTVYESKFDTTFNLTSGGTLTMDGLRFATYQNGEVIESAYYVTSTSILGGTIVTMQSPTILRKFIITETKEEDSSGVVVEGDEEKEEVIIYTATEKLPTYAEYYFKSEESVYYAPLLVIDDEQAGYANVYGYTAERTFLKVLSGTYETLANGNLKFTATTTTPQEVLTNPFDLTTIGGFEFNTGVTTSSPAGLAVHYWFNYVNTESATTDFTEVYTATTGESLTLANGFAIYTAGDKTYVADYTLVGNIVQFVYNDMEQSKQITFCFEIDEDTNKLIVMEEAPYTANVYEKGTVKQNETIFFDGKGGASYTFGEAESTQTVEGTVTYTGEDTEYDDIKIYKFTSATKTFNFIKLYASGAPIVCIMNDEVGGVYTSTTDGRLYVDGFGYRAIYTDINEVDYQGAYQITGENNDVVIIVSGSTNQIFKVSGTSFEILGNEYGEYVFSNNGLASDLYVLLDGQGVSKVFTMSGEVRTPVATGTYTYDNGDVTVVYTVGSETTTKESKVANRAYVLNGKTYRILSVINEDIVKTYVNGNDWSTLTLDSVGNATRYDSEGIKQVGTYTLITDELLYFATNDGTDACVYSYNDKTAVATPFKFTARGYYTEDLDSLLFSQYGFAIFNGGDRYYYNVVNNNVIIYRQDASDPSANEYGFVEDDNFGMFDTEKRYGGKTYYSNNGFAITFAREQDGTENDYPVVLTQGATSKYPLQDLNFAPNGKEEFTVTGVITINGRQYNCYVVREKDSEGHLVTYIVSGSYYIDITLTYRGEDSKGESLSSYVVTGMRGVSKAMAYAYLDNYYRYYVSRGATYAAAYENNIGSISLNYEFDKEGENSKQYISCEFGSASNLYDINGDIVSFDNAELVDSGNQGLYKAVIDWTDGYTYVLYFYFRAHPAYRSTSGYRVYAFARVETLETADGNYTFTTGRIVYSDDYAQGLMIDPSLKDKDDEEITIDGTLRLNGVIYCVSRTIDETTGKITASTYYRLDLESNTQTQVGDEGVSILPTYKSLSVTPLTMSIVYTADGKDFVEMTTDTVYCVCVNNTMYFGESSYDEGTETYTFRTGAKTFTITKGAENTVVITEVIDEE